VPCLPVASCWLPMRLYYAGLPPAHERICAWGLVKRVTFSWKPAPHFTCSARLRCCLLQEAWRWEGGACYTPLPGSRKNMQWASQHCMKKKSYQLNTYIYLPATLPASLHTALLCTFDNLLHFTKQPLFLPLPGECLTSEQQLLPACLSLSHLFPWVIACLFLCLMCLTSCCSSLPVLLPSAHASSQLLASSLGQGLPPAYIPPCLPLIQQPVGTRSMKNRRRGRMKKVKRREYSEGGLER